MDDHNHPLDVDTIADVYEMERSVEHLDSLSSDAAKYMRVEHLRNLVYRAMYRNIDRGTATLEEYLLSDRKVIREIAERMLGCQR